VSDVPYDRTFVHQLTPSGLRLAAALNGVTPPPEDDFDYLDLGSGPGDTLVGLAAANPRARFVGVDISPEYVAFANELARKGGVTNVRSTTRSSRRSTSSRPTESSRGSAPPSARRSSSSRRTS
jgi:SAM-dependent methyltransferase